MTQLTKVTSHKLVHSSTSSDNCGEDDDIDNRDFGNDNVDSGDNNYGGLLGHWIQADICNLYKDQRKNR